MPEPDVRLNESYSVGVGDVFLSVTIGEGQNGTSSVYLDENRLVSACNHIGLLLVGNGTAVQGKTLLVRSVVNDVSAMTNRMSVTYMLKGGVTDQTFTARGQVKNEGDLLIFEAKWSLNT